jgi:soluble lytic murein transglycosylase-like protein
MLQQSLSFPATVVTVVHRSLAPPPRWLPASARSSARPEARIRFSPIVRQLAVGIAAACTVVFTASQVHPVFLGQAPVAGRVLAAAYLDSASIRAPWLSLPEALAMRHPQFQRDVDAFASDLRGTGKIDGDRADSIAAVAVREAYHRRIPPALILGVMLTENDGFKSHARSNVGALGLMQIMPRLWTPNLGPILGKNLKDDETNVRYGVYILKHFAKRTADSLDAGDVTRIALLNYNGCVRGSNTPDCRAYPIKVQRHVENSARESCSGRAFQECVALPLWAALRDTMPPPMPGASLASTVPAASTDRVHPSLRASALTRSIGHWLGGAN